MTSFRPLCPGKTRDFNKCHMLISLLFPGGGGTRFQEGLNGVSRQPSNGLNFDRQASNERKFNRQASK